MILKKQDGTEIGATIRKSGNNFLLFIDAQGTGAKTREELEEYIQNKANLVLEECELVSASEREKNMLREANINLTGL